MMNLKSIAAVMFLVALVTTGAIALGTNDAFRLQIAATPDREVSILVDGQAIKASVTPTRGVRSPLLTGAPTELPIPAGYEDIDSAALFAEILVYPDGSADFVRTLLFACAPTSVLECAGAASTSVIPIFEQDAAALVAQTPFDPSGGSLPRLGTMAVAFSSTPVVDPLRVIGPITECQANCCGQVGGTPQETENGLECEMNDNGDDEIFALKLAQFSSCSAENCE